MRYRMIDGEEYSGRSYREVVAAMARDKLAEPRSLEGYRRATARRVQDMYGKQVSAVDNGTFVRGLVSVGLMERVQ